MFDKDMIFFHPPSVYDFRERPEVFGPISDVIPSSSIFEMYPIGITSLAEYLERYGYNAQIINLAYRMLQSSSYNPEKVIRCSQARYFGVDLHWLPHAHGSLEVAKLIKKYHPDKPVIFGGYSSSYYHEELIDYPEVDFVIRGDSTEEPLLQLIETLDNGGDLSRVPNLTWKSGGETVVNDFDFIPQDLDYASLPAYDYVFKSVLKYGSMKNVVPYQGWFDYPTTMLLISRGCSVNCPICGGCGSAIKDVSNREKGPAFRSPSKLIEDVKFISSFSKAPIFVVHDPRMGGEDYANQFFDLLEKEDIDNEFVFELFAPASEDYLKRLDDATSRYSLQISVESHLERIRKGKGGKFPVSNAKFEETLVTALQHGCRKIDIFFMVGLPEQTYEDAVDVVDYCRELLPEIGAGKIVPFVAPLAPFLDPASPAFENPEEYGYHKLCHSLEDHRQALLEPSWKHMLSYETDWMTRDDIANATYDSALGLNELKYELDLLEEEVYFQVKERITESRQILEEIDDIYELPSEQQDAKLESLQKRLSDFGKYSICDQDEMKWPNSSGLRNIFALGRLTASLFWQELKGKFVSNSGVYRE
ncbi:TIGR04190 family B12-binding domain/radical SAM domain protein [Natroniella acetigena]|uniref:TIGR04190 family B12-binding domain/radical SAM domain protein n=1 Tax=Natroniella acetigena TaxID=52004 RepID=UPI00200B4536|nr:TIGR04190 family B12-binding domain/radical SAM domain protein [Natroniella acetigena]MCK8826137.1 TIGR04190 family B12-binding domain/radical SAM domain protein [Natroniella acetigena]